VLLGETGVGRKNETPRVAPVRSGGRHVPSLDGIRCVALVGVLGVHCGFPGAGAGWIGVDLFFVLSGFLITALMTQEYRKTGTIRLRMFWGRRLLRLMPAYWLYAAGLCVAMFVFHWGRLQKYGWWTPRTFTASLFFYFTNFKPTGVVWEHEWLSLHLWSLSVEEQFYFTWPVLCLLLLRKRAEWFAWALVAAILVNMTVFAGDMLAFHRLDVRGFGIMLGCATALTLDRARWLVPWLSSRGARAAVVAATVLSLVALTATSAGGWLSELDASRYVLPVVCLGFAALVAMLWYGPDDAIAGALSWGPMVYVGKISYGMYLYHMLAHHLTWGVLLVGIDGWPRWPKFALRVVTYVALTTGIATLSYYAFERPFLALKSRFR